MYVYRVNGLSSDEPSRPVYDIAIMDYKMQLPNYFISYSPIEFLNQNTRLSDSDKIRLVFNFLIGYQAWPIRKKVENEQRIRQAARNIKNNLSF